MKLGTVQGRAGVKISGKIVQDKEHLCISFSSVQGKLSYLQGASPSSTVDISNVQGAYVWVASVQWEIVQGVIIQGANASIASFQGAIAQDAIVFKVKLFNVQLSKV